MPVSLPVPTKNPGDVYTSAMWNSYTRDNINKLLDRGHRVLTVAAFAALTGLEDGDEVYLEVDSTNGIIWHLRYVAAEPTYKWRFLGGPPLTAIVDTAEGNVTSTSYADATTAGPTVTTPRAGDYDVLSKADLSDDNNVSENHVAPSIGGATPLDADGVCVTTTSTSLYSTAYAERRKTALAASAAIKLQYKRGSASGSHLLCRFREVAIRPVRLS